MKRRTIIVDGPLAFRMRRIEAARAGEAVEILTLPLLAARLAGGFIRPALASDIEQAVSNALEAGGFSKIETARDLPGFVRAAARSLADLWDEGRTLSEATFDNAQAVDVGLLESRVRAALPLGVLCAIDLRDAALARIAHAPAALGTIELDRVFHVAPVWRMLIAALGTLAPVTWRDRPANAEGWFSGPVLMQSREAVKPEHVLCANPRAEVVEALRWLRSLIATGVAPHEIAIVATAVEPFDDHFHALAGASGLPLHVAHGVSALATHGGQACAALGDILLRGLSQERFRRLASYAVGQSTLLGSLPGDWSAGLYSEARLTTRDQWRAALIDAAARGHADLSAALMPAIDLLASGHGAAVEAGAKLLPSAAQPIWASAMRRAPVAAIEQTLREIRFGDQNDPGACAVWGSAEALAGAPRAHMRLLGLSSQNWPRRRREDPLLPQHAFTRSTEGTTPTERDRAAFAHLVTHASGSCVISRSRRSAQGGRQAPSPLVVQVPRDAWRRLRRDRRPEHAFNEADRLLARPEDRAANARIARATACFVNRRRADLTPHDGLIPAGHTLIAETLAQPQSATSLKTMLRDPLGYLWRYVMGWEAPRDLAGGLGLDARSYGDLLHDVLRRMVQDLAASTTGFARASGEDVAQAALVAARQIEAEWPLRKAVPPPLLWKHTLELAVTEACGALKQAVGEGTQSWTEVRFGRDDDDGTAELPWRPTASVALAESGLRITGAIDRLDRRADKACRVTDYKTGAIPPETDFKIRGGEELQRVIYTHAVRQLLPESQHVTAVLLYLREGQTASRPIVDMEAGAFEDAIVSAVTTLQEGRCVAGIDAFARFNDYALALPAVTEAYRLRKGAALDRALAALKPVWDLQ